MLKYNYQPVFAIPSAIKSYLSCDKSKEFPLLLLILTSIRPVCIVMNNGFECMSGLITCFGSMSAEQHVNCSDSILTYHAFKQRSEPTLFKMYSGLATAFL